MHGGVRTDRSATTKRAQNRKGQTCCLDIGKMTNFRIIKATALNVAPRLKANCENDILPSRKTVNRRVKKTMFFSAIDSIITPGLARDEWKKVRRRVSKVLSCV